MNKPDSERVLVLFGLAGTGKSSIAYELAGRFRDMNRLTSYFAFLRAEKSKGEDYVLLTTIIHGLCNRYPSFKTALGKVIRDNKPLRAARDYHTLFESMILQPLKDVHTVGPIFIIIDALDESGDAIDRTGLHTFLAEHLASLPSNFRILITSRLEQNIMDAFDKVTKASFQIVHMDDSKLAARTGNDIRLYFEKHLSPDLLTQYGDKLVEKAEGLFQWAAVACKYINNAPGGLSGEDCICALLKLSTDHEELNEKLGPLDSLYKQVLEGYLETPFVQRRFVSIMGQLLAAFEPLSIHSLTAMPGYLGDPLNKNKQSVISATLRPLGSLLSNVTSTSTDETLPIVPLHTSFRDFLTNKKKSGDFYIDLRKAHYQLARACLDLMLSDLKFNICNLETSYLPNSEILVSRINRHISPALFYACCFWDDHLHRLSFNRDLLARLQSLFKTKFLFWLEVLSLKSSVDLAIPALSTLKAWLASGHDNEVHPTVQHNN